MSSPPTDYASLFGVKSFAAAVVFAVLYFPLLIFFLFKTISRPIYIYFILTLFCAIRVTAFILRALLARDTAAAESLSVFIAFEILYNSGFFGLLYSAYTLVNDRIDRAKNPPTNPISRVLRMRLLFRVGMIAAVAIGITGAIESTNGSASGTSSGNTLREVAFYVFLVGVVLVLLQTIFLARAELSDRSYHTSSDPIGSTFGVYIILVISLLLIIREVFFAATAKKLTIEDNEAYWYPLAVVTEFLAVVLFAIPGLVPQPPKEP